MRNLLKTGILVLVFASTIFAQAKVIKSAEDLSALNLNFTTPEEALALLGKPADDSIGKLEYEMSPSHAVVSLVTGTNLRLPESWVSSKKEQKIFRKLVFKQNVFCKKIELSFLEDRLYLIDLTLTQKKNARLLAAALEKIYETDFVSIESLPEKSLIADYENQKEPTIPKAYAKFYGMLSIAPTKILLAFVNNDSFKKEFWSGTGKPEKNMFPGVVAKVQIISRDIEIKSGFAK